MTQNGQVQGNQAVHNGLRSTRTTFELQGPCPVTRTPALRCPHFASSEGDLGYVLPSGYTEA